MSLPSIRPNPSPWMVARIRAIERAFAVDDDQRCSRLRHEVMANLKRHCPPLEPADLLALVHFRLARGAEKAIMPDAAMRKADEHACFSLAAGVMLQSVPDECMKAGLAAGTTVLLRNRDRFDFFGDRLNRWHESDFS